MKCQSKFQTIRPLQVRIEDAIYWGMEKIPTATNLRVLNTGSQGGKEWAIFEYDWPDDAGYRSMTNEVNARTMPLITQASHIRFIRRNDLHIFNADISAASTQQEIGSVAMHKLDRELPIIRRQCRK